jgi:hypothetical protein
VSNEPLPTLSDWPQSAVDWFLFVAGAILLFFLVPTMKLRESSFSGCSEANLRVIV